MKKLGYGQDLLKLSGNKLILYASLMRVHKPIGFFLLLWPTLIALWIAGKGQPEPVIVGIFIVGTFIMRSAGCVINDILDQRFDSQVSRTKERPLAKGLLSTKEALLVFGCLMLMALLLVLQLNIQTILLSCVAAVLAMIYPWMKRVIQFPQAVLGIAFGFGIPMAFMALQETVPAEAWILFLATVLWVIAYDTEYAMVDRQDDLKIGIKSTAITFGKFDKVIIFWLQFSSLMALIFLGYQQDFRFLFFSGIALAGISMLYQQYLIKNRNAEGCFRAFLNNNYTGAAVFIGCSLDYLYSMYYL